ncbi:MAG: hypothetical protein ACNY01_01380 [Desulfobacteria bacterium]
MPSVEGRKKRIGGMAVLSKTVGTYNIPPRFRCVESTHQTYSEKRP